MSVDLALHRPAPGPAAPPAGALPAELCVVVPTLNEHDNIRPFLDGLQTVLRDVAWEVIFVDDDSRDGTADLVRAIAQQDPRVRCLQRIGRRGLSTACIEGALSSSAPFVAIMDADLQHDEALLPDMLEALKLDRADIVVGSRYAQSGSVGDWNRSRASISSLATRLSRLVCKVDIADPMSGYFMMRRGVFHDAMRRLSGQGFKILLDVLASLSHPPRVLELPFRFRQRQHGSSKLDSLVAWEYGMLLADKLVGPYVPARFVLFSMIGAVGLVVHLIALRLGLIVLQSNFVAAQSLATLVAIASNFLLNNLFTYRDQRLRGVRLLRGLLSFYLICGFGAVANIGIAAYVFQQNHLWWAAGVAGVLIGSVWNYGVSSIFTWRKA